MLMRDLVRYQSALALSPLLSVDGAKAYRINRETRRLREALEAYRAVVDAPLKRRQLDEITPDHAEYETVLAEMRAAEEQAGDEQVPEVQDSARITEDELAAGLEGLRCAGIHIDALWALFGKQ